MSVVSPRSVSCQALQDIIRLMPNCIAIVDQNRRVVACNWYGLESFPQHLKHAHLFCHEIFDMHEGQPCVVDAVFASGQPGTFEKNCLRMVSSMLKRPLYLMKRGRLFLLFSNLIFRNTSNIPKMNSLIRRGSWILPIRLLL